MIDVLDRNIVDHLIPPLAANAPSSTLFIYRVKIIVDTIFVALPKSPFLPRNYHKKSPMKAAWKYEIAFDFSHRIVSVSDGYHGGAHDMRIIRESGLLEQASDDAQMMGNRGYKGKLGIVVPAAKKAKVSKEVQQLENESRRGYELQTERAAIENINERGKEWAVVRGVWNGQRESADFFDSVMRVLCALTNLLLIAHPIRCASLRSGSRTSVS